MTKDVLICISGLHNGPEVEDDPLEVIVGGEYYYRNQKHYLIYDEIMDGTDEQTHNIIKMKPDYMELTRKGPVNVRMLFEKNQKNMTLYHTPFGSLSIGIDATKVEVTEKEDRIIADVEYSLDMNDEKVADCHIHIEVRPKK